MQTATADPLIGRALERRYRIRHRIARGGMSVVYAATDERLDRTVAVKVMNPQLCADPAFANRFAHEARNAAKLTHGNVVSVYDQGEDLIDGYRVVFLVMELVTGRTLRELLRERGRLSAAQAVSVMEPVLLALSAAHRAGLVHRDVKPENILLADDGTVKVADFGLARAVESETSVSRTGVMMGTVAYCPPEQITRGRNDQRSDVYSAGIVLFELLTGRAPYAASSAMEVAYQHVHGQVPLVSSLVPGVGAALEDLVSRATDSDPAGRPLDAGCLLAEMVDVRNDMGLPVVGVPGRPVRQRTAGPGVVPGSGRPDAPTEHVGTATERISPGPASEEHTARQRADEHTARQRADEHTARQRADEYTARVNRRQDTMLDWSAEAGGHPEAADRLEGGQSTGVPRPRRTRRARRRLGVFVLVVVLALGAAIAYGSWWLLAGRYGTVPEVAGMPVAQVQQSLTDAGFKPGQQQREYSEQVPRGAVIATDPRPGSHVVHGRSIDIDISLGAQRWALPSVTGKSGATAVQTLHSIPVTVVQKPAYSDTVAAGTVLSTDPVAGTQMRRDQQVVVTVSQGLPFIQVPNVVGKSSEDASDAITGAGLKVTVSQQPSDTIAEGLVVSQTPPDGQVRKFSTITLVVSSGPPMVAVPKINPGTNVDDAVATLQAAGLVVEQRSAYGSPLHKVIAMDPGAGTEVRKGSTVIIYVI